jgi:hypothetical protein
MADQVDPSSVHGDYVEFPDDSFNTGKKVVYREATIRDTAVYLPTTVLVDEDGRMVDLADLVRQTNDQLALLLRGVIRRLDLLNHMVSDSYTAPDNLSEEE